MRSLLIAALTFSACSSSPAPAKLASDGSISYGGLVVAAPIIPDSAAFAQFSQPAAYGMLDSTAKTMLVTSSTKTFTELLSICAADDPTIVATPTTPAELDANYAAVAKCAYSHYGPTPGWVPQLVSDVDICNTKLGDGWTAASTADLVVLPSDYPQQLVAATAATASTEPLYDTLRTYALNGIGTVEILDLGTFPIALTTLGSVSPKVVDTDSIGVRCISEP